MKKDDRLVKLGAGIRLERLRRKMSQEDLAEKAGIPQYQQISRFERADVDMRVSKLLSILEALDCKLEDLIS